MNREELRKVIKGTIVTVPTPFDEEMRLDLPRMKDLTQWWVEQGLGSGIAPLKVAAAMGEGPMLDDDEWPVLLQTVVDAAGKDAYVICALKSKDTYARYRGREESTGPGRYRPADRPTDLPWSHPG